MKPYIRYEFKGGAFVTTVAPRWAKLFLELSAQFGPPINEVHCG